MTAEALLAELRGLADPERAERARAYLKVDLDHLGVPVPEVRRVALRHLPADDVRGLVQDLWRHRLFEARLAAVELLRARTADLVPDDVALLEALLRDAGTWALVDPLAADVVGWLAEEHDLGAVLDRWSSDDDVWLRRSALLALLVPLKRGDGDWDRFARYADALLEDRGFWVRKAIGWVLRETGKQRPELVGEWLLPRASRASGVTVREAVKHLPEPLRQAVLARR